LKDKIFAQLRDFFLQWQGWHESGIPPWQPAITLAAAAAMNDRNTAPKRTKLWLEHFSKRA
jgi:hypothetical protein